MSKRDYYDVLGVAKGASKDEIPLLWIAAPLTGLLVEVRALKGFPFHKPDLSTKIVDLVDFV